MSSVDALFLCSPPAYGFLQMFYGIYIISSRFLFCLKSVQILSSALNVDAIIYHKVHFSLSVFCLQLQCKFISEQCLKDFNYA